MKTTHRLLHLFILLLISFVSAFAGNQKEEKYFVTNAYKRIDFTEVRRVSGDTIFLKLNDTSFSVNIDSLILYRHLKQGKAGAGFITGATIGTVLGFIVGGFYGGSPYGGEYAPLIGASTGFLLGGLIGLAVGSGANDDAVIFLNAFNKNEKKQFLLRLIES